MCRNQLGRRNITDEQKTALIGEAYKAQKMSYGASDGFRGNQHIQKVSAQNEHLAKGRTSEVIAKYFGVGKETVKRAEQFLDGLNEAEKVSPGIKETVLSGSLKTPKSAISEIRNLSNEEKKKAVEAIKEGKKPTIQKPKQPRLSSSDIDLIEKFRRSVKGFYCFLLGAVLFLSPSAMRAAHSENFCDA